MEVLAKIFEVLNNKISLPVAIFCAFLLFAPNWLLEKMEIIGFVNSSKSAISLTFLFSALLYGYENGKKLIQFAKERHATSTKREATIKAIASHLDGLSMQEEAWIYYCLRENTRTLVAIHINATAISLLNKQIVYGPNTPHDILATPFTLRNEIWEYLANNRDKFCSQDKLENAVYNRRVDELVAGLRSVF